MEGTTEITRCELARAEELFGDVLAVDVVQCVVVVLEVVPEVLGVSVLSTQGGVASRFDGRERVVLESRGSA